MDSQGRGNYAHPSTSGEDGYTGDQPAWTKRGLSQPRIVIKGHRSPIDPGTFALCQQTPRESPMNRAPPGVRVGSEEANRMHNMYKIDEIWKPGTDQPRYPRQWDGASQDVRNYSWWRDRWINSDVPNPGADEYENPPSVFEEENELGHAERPRSPATNMEQLDISSAGDSYPEQHPIQPRRVSLRSTTPQQGDYPVAALESQEPCTQEHQVPSRTLQPPIGTGRPRRLSRPDNAYPGDPPRNTPTSFTTQPANNYNQANAVQSAPEMHSPYTVRPLHTIDDSGIPSFPSPTPKPARPKYVSPVPPGWHRGLLLTPEQIKQNHEACEEFNARADKIIAACKEEESRRRQNQPSTSVRDGLQPPDMPYAGSAAGYSGDESTFTDIGLAEQREMEAERIRRDRAFLHVVQSCMRLSGVLGAHSGPVHPLRSPMAPVPGSNGGPPALNPPVARPLGWRSYEDLRSCLLEWGKRGGTATLPLKRITFFHAASRREDGPLQPIPGPENRFRGRNIKTLFAEDGVLAAHAVQIPDQYGEPREWIWFEMKQAMAEIHGNAPIEFQGRPEAWVVMALPTQNAYTYSWFNTTDRGKAGTQQYRAVGLNDPNLPEATPAAAAYHVWSSDVLPSMQFSKKPRFITDLVEDPCRDFLGIPSIGPYPQTVDETSEVGKDIIRQWWGNLGAAIQRDAGCWVYMRDLMKNNILGIELMAELPDEQKWNHERGLLAARQWTHSANAGPLAEFCDLVGPKLTISTAIQPEPNRPSGLQSGMLPGTSQSYYPPPSGGEFANRTAF